MSFAEFLRLIEQSPVGRAVNRRVDLIERTDPDRIYVENIREFIGMPFAVAHGLCELAVRERLFTKHVGVLCPNDESMILTAAAGAELPIEVECETCELLERPHRFHVADLRTITFYSAR